jgi:hypothetical protein
MGPETESMEGFGLIGLDNNEEDEADEDE